MVDELDAGPKYADRMSRLAFPALLAVALLAGCGGSSKSSQTTTSTTTATPSPAAAMRALIVKDPALAGKVTTLYESSGWSVVQSVTPKQADAVVFRLIGDKWVADKTGAVKIDILGPQPGAVAPPHAQVAIQFSGKTPFVESASWIDGQEVPVLGGGSPTRGTIYGALKKPLKAGQHVAVGYARTGLTGSAVAWLFKVG
jgi:hypothetical protein